MENVLSVRDLHISVRGEKPLSLVKNVSFDVEAGRCLGILGESGSGKSLTCGSLVGLLGSEYAVSGEVRFNGRNLLTANREELRRLRGAEISMILQNPMTSFDPLRTIESHILETLRAHGRVSRKEALAAGREMLARMRIEDPDGAMRRYPHQMSGGMLQRTMIGLALLLGPKLIVADEPTTALDSITRFEVVEEIRRMREECECAMIFVSHDLGVLASVADSVLVMHEGEVVEKGELRRVFASPRSEQARYLLGTRFSLIDRFRRMVRNEGGAPSRMDYAAASF